MTVLSPPRHPVVTEALTLARSWCSGQIIDGAPALAHAARVAVILVRHVPDAAPEMVAAALLHDAPEFAPADLDLDAALIDRVGAEAVRVIRTLEREHLALAADPSPPVSTQDIGTLLASAADKMVSLASILSRVTRSEDQDVFWATRAPFLIRVPYFRTFHTRAKPHLPAGMAAELDRLVALAERVARTHL